MAGRGFTRARNYLRLAAAVLAMAAIKVHASESVATGRVENRTCEQIGPNTYKIEFQPHANSRAIEVFACESGAHRFRKARSHAARDHWNYFRAGTRRPSLFPFEIIERRHQGCFREELPLQGARTIFAISGASVHRTAIMFVGALVYPDNSIKSEPSEVT